jgi:hypothetical protein
LHTFRRMHVFNHKGTAFPGTDQDVRWNDGLPDGNTALLEATRVGWIKIWANWAILQPNAASDPIGQGPAGGGKMQLPADHLAAIDNQITFIRTHARPAISKLKIILQLREFPLWSNAGRRKAFENSDVEHTGPDASYLAFPDQVDVSSPWAAYIGFLVDRYTRTAANPTRYVDGIEIVNEPNLECWPQVTGQKVQGKIVGTPSAHCFTAQMFGSALVRRDAAVGNLGQSTQVLLKPLLLGPGSSDYFQLDSGGDPQDTQKKTTYETFNNLLLVLLQALRFTAPLDFIWTHHNYNDASFDLGVDTTDPTTDHVKRASKVNRAQHARRLLIGRWSGGPYGDLNVPYLFITEGGVHRATDWASVWSLQNTNSAWNGKHGELMQRMLSRMQNESDGKGIGMVSQYHFYTDPSFDAGLCDPRAGNNAAPPSPNDGARREPAFGNWSNATSYPNVR